MLTFDKRGIEKAVNDLKRFKEAIPNVAGNEIVKQIVEYAASSRAPNNAAWPPLTAAYAKKVGRALSTKRVTGGLLNSVRNRYMVVGPDEAHTPQAKGLEKKRVSFEVAVTTAQNIERLLLQKFEKLLA